MSTDYKDNEKSENVKHVMKCIFCYSSAWLSHCVPLVFADSRRAAITMTTSAETCAFTSNPLIHLQHVWDQIERFWQPAMDWSGNLLRYIQSHGVQKIYQLISSKNKSHNVQYLCVLAWNLCASGFWTIMLRWVTFVKFSRCLFF